MEFMVNCYNKSDHKLSWEGKMMKTIRKTAIVMPLFVYFLTYGVLPQVLAAGIDTPMIVVAHRAGAKVAPENTLAALEQAIRERGEARRTAAAAKEEALASQHSPELMPMRLRNRQKKRATSDGGSLSSNHQIIKLQFHPGNEI